MKCEDGTGERIELHGLVDQRHQAAHAGAEIDRLTVPVVVNEVVASLQAASSNNAGSARSGSSQTSLFNCQFRVAPDQRSGQRCLAAS